MKWLLSSLGGDSNVQLLLRFLEVLCRLNKRMAVVAEGEETLELKFRIFDGTDICRGTYTSSITTAAIKERLLSEWPQDKSHAPTSANDMKLIHAGRVLNNEKTLAESGVHNGDHPGVVITMHVVVQPVNRQNTGNQANTQKCGCAIL